MPSFPDALCWGKAYEETVLEVVEDKSKKLELPGDGYMEVPDGALPPSLTSTETHFLGLKFYKPIPNTLNVDFLFVVVSNVETILEVCRYVW